LCCAAEMKKQLDTIGPEKVVSIVTDNGGGCENARKIATSGPDYRHIVPLR
jgi:hypothetical protein